jgi:hypothetical protein
MGNIYAFCVCSAHTSGSIPSDNTNTIFGEKLDGGNERFEFQIRRVLQVLR